MQTPNELGPGFDLVWWITAVELPALAGLFWISWRNLRASDDAIEDVRARADTKIQRLRQSLDAYKLDVAKSYASMSYIKDVESRLTRHLIRIEEKLDLARSQAITSAGGTGGGK